MNLEQMNIQTVYSCSDYYEKIFITESYLFLTCITPDNETDLSTSSVPTNGKNLVITSEDLAGDLLYKVI